MANIDIIGQTKGLFGGFSMGGAFNIIGYGILLFVIAGVVIFFVYKRLMDKKFNKSITFWKRNPQTGVLVADKTIKAMTVRLDSFGNLGYRLKKPYETKNLMPRLKLEAKPNVHYVEYCSDGRLVEFVGIGDYDDQRKSMSAKFTDENTELARSSLHQMNKERYEKKNFWKENMSLIVNIGAIVVIMIFLYLIADKLISLVGQIGGLLDQAGEVQQAQSNIIDSLNNMLSVHGVS